MYGNKYPTRLTPLRPVDRVKDDTTGNAGIDGFTRLSTADRETGYRPPVGEQATAWPRYVED